MSSQKRQSPFPAAAQEEILATLSTSGKRRWVEPVVSRGRWWWIRRALGYALILFFVAGPHIVINDKPAIFLNMAMRQFTFFGVTLHPTDNVILAAFGATVLITAAIITTLFGRLWCGYLCPQPVYLEFIFRPIESLFEGPPHERRRRDAKGWTAARILRKIPKWVVFALIAAFMATTFISYFASWDGLLEIFATGPAKHPGVFAAFGILTGLIWFDFTIFREQMCTIACPYGRLQTVVYDRDTSIVGYDATRGEPRGAIQAQGEQQTNGDCIDCRRCIATCPTGIDIRRGLQMECIGCAQCIDACDTVMESVGRPKGLIRYTSLRELAGGATRLLRPRVFAYTAIATLVYAILLTLLLTRTTASVEVLRTAQEPFRMLPTGEVANQLRVRVTNNLDKPQSFTIEMLEPASGELVVAINPFECKADGVETVNIVVKLPKAAFTRGRAEGRFKITTDAEFETEKKFLLLGPY